MKLAAAPLAGLGLLAACSTEPQVDARNASVEEVAEQVAGAAGSDSFVRPGKWQSRVRIEKFELPGAPPEASAAMRSMHERAQVHESCLTPEQARRPKEDFFADANKSCRYDHFTMGDGKIDAVMKCGGDGMVQTMAMQGTYAPESYRMRMSIKADAGAGPPGGMTMIMAVEAKRVGECDGKAASMAATTRERTMRTIILGLAAAVLASCSSDSAQEAKRQAKAESLQPGEYQVTDKVDELRSTDNSTPATPTRAAAPGEPPATVRTCVGADGAIDSKIFAEAGDQCASTGSYMRGGRLSFQYNCTRPGKGGVSQLVDGKFTADSFEASVTSSTYFGGSGDYSLTRTLTGKRVGDCPAAPPAAAAAAAQ